MLFKTGRYTTALLQPADQLSEDASSSIVSFTKLNETTGFDGIWDNTFLA